MVVTNFDFEIDPIVILIYIQNISCNLYINSFVI